MKIGKSFVMLSIIASAYLYAESTKLGDVTVTANKIEENIMEVPQSISVITGEKLEEKRIYGIADLVQQIPNMSMQSVYADSAEIQFRGINVSFLVNANPIVIYLDGVPYYDIFDMNPSLANVERIEVLRGAQGTLYGKDGIGGVINIITKTPTNKWSGTVGAEYGSQNYLRGSLNVSGAIIPNKLYAGINGSFSSDDGWVTNHYAGNKKNADEESRRQTSVFLLYKPTDVLSTKLVLNDNYLEGFEGFTVGAGVDFNDLKHDDVKDASFESPTFTENSVQSQSLNISYELKNMKLEAVTTHKIVDSDAEYDGDRVSDAGLLFGKINPQYIDIETYTQEIKLVSKNQNIKWVSGVYFDKEEREQGPFGVTADFTGGGVLAELFNDDSTIDSETQAIFGQAIIPLKDFELTLGVRYQRIKKEINSITTFGGRTPAAAFGSGWDGVYDDEKTWNAFLPKVALLYNINDNMTSYASISQGYTPGGFNFFVDDITAQNSFEPQTSTNYEIGLKMQGDKYVFNVAVFRMDIEDLQDFGFIDGRITVANAPKAHSQGIEFDGEYLLSDTLSVSGAIGLLEVEFDEYSNTLDSGVTTTDLAGTKPVNSPKYTANLGMSYKGDSGIYGRLDFNAKGSAFYSLNEENEVDATIVSNIKIGYKINDWDIYGYVTNITDEVVINQYSSSSTTGSTFLGFNDPQRFGVGAKYSF